MIYKLFDENGEVNEKGKSWGVIDGFHQWVSAKLHEYLLEI